METMTMNNEVRLLSCRKRFIGVTKMTTLLFVMSKYQPERLTFLSENQANDSPFDIITNPQYGSVVYDCSISMTRWYNQGR